VHVEVRGRSQSLTPCPSRSLGPNLRYYALHPQDTQAAWIAFIKGCEVFNVSNVSPLCMPG
jgi:hypothetical protein